MKTGELVLTWANIFRAHIRADICFGQCSW